MNETTVTEIVGGEPYEYVLLRDHVARAVGVCGGRPTFKHARVEVAGVADRLAHGDSLEEIAKSYRGRVPREAVSEALEMACLPFRPSRSFPRPSNR